MNHTHEYSREPLKKKPRRIALVFLQMGGPQTISQVQPFLENLFKDPFIIRLPKPMRVLQPLLAKLISRKRAPLVKTYYEKIGGGSPLLQITSSFAEKMQDQLKSRELSVKSFTCMRYTQPRSHEVVKSIQQYKPKLIVLFPLYPHYSKTTTGSSMHDFMQALNHSTFLTRVPIELIEDWSTIPPYINWWVSQIKSLYNSLPLEERETSVILFSAHGIPKRYVTAGDPYPHRVQQAFEQITQSLKHKGVQAQTLLSFQSNVGPIEWLRPYTHDVLSNSDLKGATTLIMVPLGFVSDHLETLYEMDFLYKQVALENGIANFYRIPVMNDNDMFIEELAVWLSQYLKVRLNDESD